MIFLVSFFSFSFFTNASSGGEWSCTDASLDVDGSFEGETIKEKFSYECSELMAPTKYSYSCAKATLKTEPKNDTNSISFKRFQVRNMLLFHSCSMVVIFQSMDEISNCTKWP